MKKVSSLPRDNEKFIEKPCDKDVLRLFLTPVKICFSVLKRHFKRDTAIILFASDELSPRTNRSYIAPNRSVPWQSMPR